MKTILYMTITVDGFICKTDGSVDYTLDGTWNSYFNFCKKNGNLIIGRHTYDIMPPEEFIEDCLYVVMTHTPPESPKIKNVMFTDQTPAEVIKILTEKGFQTIVVGGGGQINSAFLDSGLIDELLLDVQPVVLGQGIKIFPDTVTQHDLELLESKNISDQEIQLRYRVKK